MKKKARSYKVKLKQMSAYIGHLRLTYWVNDVFDKDNTKIREDVDEIYDILFEKFK